MRLRWLSAAVGIPLFLFLVLWDRYVFAGAVLILAFGALAEIVRVQRAQGLRPNLWIASLGIVIPTLSWLVRFSVLDPFRVSGYEPAHIQSRFHTLLTLLPICSIGILFAGLLAEVVSAARTGRLKAIENFSAGLFSALYVALFTGMVWIRGDNAPNIRYDDPLEYDVNHMPYMIVERGAATLLVAVFAVWATDSFALFVGKAFGKRKLAPNLSPGKTIEGSIGGLAAGTLFGALFGWLFMGLPFFGLLVGVIAGIFGQVGDLFASALKREYGVKDFGGILPGHGGILDRFDSLLFVAPLVCLLLTLMGGNP